MTGKTEEQLKSDTSSLFMTNIILTTKINKLVDENEELRTRLNDLEVSLAEREGNSDEQQYKCQTDS